MPLDNCNSFAESFASEAILQQAIAGLLVRMPNTSEVQIIHGPSEIGKDILFRIPGAFGELQLCACAVKNVRITGNLASSAGARNIFHQVSAALDTTHTNTAGREEIVEIVYVIAPYDLSEMTIKSIVGALREKGGRVKFVTGAALFDLFRKHWPEYLAQEAALLAQYVKDNEATLLGTSPLRDIAFQYTLGEVDKTIKQVYVPQSFYIDISVFKLSNIFELSMLSDAVIKEGEWDTGDISRLEANVKQINEMIEYLYNVGLVTKQQLAAVYRHFRLTLDYIAKAYSTSVRLQMCNSEDRYLRLRLADTDKVLSARDYYVSSIKDALNKRELRLLSG
jgi:hypothetical protein